MRLRVAALVGLLLLCACATRPTAAPPPTPPRAVRVAPPAAPRPQAPVAAAPRRDLSPAELPGWGTEDHRAAFAAYRAACAGTSGASDRKVCQDARKLGPLDEPGARRFFETRFDARLVDQPGLLTGYFAPEYEARHEPDEVFSAAVLARPQDLRRGPDGHFPPYRTRAEIEAAPGPALAYMRPEDLFFMQIQGSGYLTFPGGGHLRAAYAADNGLPFKGIAAPLTQQGLLKASETSGDRIRAWLAEHRGLQARAITDLDTRYVFFSLQPDTGGSPAGAAGTPLPAGRAAAIDPLFHAFGDLLWLASDDGALPGAQPYRRLVIALDQGGAIKGPARVDLYVGRGEAAGAEAGRIKQPLRLYRLVPKD
jgi:membrane-bound lytic murein transglycosylase A